MVLLEIIGGIVFVVVLVAGIRWLVNNVSFNKQKDTNQDGSV